MSEEEIIKEIVFMAKWFPKLNLIKERQTILGLLDLYNKEKEKNEALKEGLKYRINYCKLLEKELYANGVNYKFEKTEIEKQFLEE